MNKLSIKYQSYPKPTKIDAFEEKICNYHNLNNNDDVGDNQLFSHTLDVNCHSNKIESC